MEYLHWRTEVHYQQPSLLPLTCDSRRPSPLVNAGCLKYVSKCLALNFIDAVGNFLCPATSLSFNGFKTVLEIYIMGMFNSCKDHGGAIVNNSATRGYTDLQVHAGSAKAANDAMTKHLAVEWGPSGVRVNTLAPGPISGTEGFCRLGGNRAERMDAFSSIPPQRVGNKMELDGGSWLTSANDISMLLGIASSQSAKLLTRPLPPSQVCWTEEEVGM
uniref:Peroxisomal 2,4-dienoyl-CoA reductase [(3E)-enoyl-CoA-producing] n=1 Tax=Oncorhynchus kisutch TaxID=8019 RepID=A0A8C7DID2_ONCKI